MRPAHYIQTQILSMFSRRADLIKEFPFVQIKTPPKTGCKCFRSEQPSVMSAMAIAREVERVKRTILHRTSPSERVEQDLRLLFGTQQNSAICTGVQRGPVGFYPEKALKYPLKRVIIYRCVS